MFFINIVFRKENIFSLLFFFGLQLSYSVLTFCRKLFKIILSYMLAVYVCMCVCVHVCVCVCVCVCVSKFMSVSTFVPVSAFVR